MYFIARNNIFILLRFIVHIKIHELVCVMHFDVLFHFCALELFVIVDYRRISQS